MNNTNEMRWKQRLDNFGTALAQLTNACERGRYDDLERAGLYSLRILVLAIVGFSFSGTASAADFTISGGVTETSPQTLGAGETGVIEAKGRLDTTGTAVTMTGATLINGGTIATIGNRARGIASRGSRDSITITGAGRVTTGGDRAHGMYSDGANVTITSEGGIATTGNSASGIYSLGADARITHRGVITTHGEWNADSGVAAYGIFAHGARSSVTVEGDGKIATTGERAHGVHSRGAAANIVNDGRIETTGQGARGIFAAGANTFLTNHGAIVTRGGFAFGMLSTDIDTTMTQAGAITTEGDRAHSMYSDGANVTINSEDGIATTGNSASGIYSLGADARITHRGVITTHGEWNADSGVAAYGIFAHGARSSVTVEGDGKIATTGARAHGVHSRGAAANIVNDGRIETTGQGARGIVAAGPNTLLTNHGAIVTKGGLAFGMASAGIDTTTTQAGVITTEGERAHGMYSDGANVTITSEGGIATTGNSASGIYSQGADARITHRGVITTDGQGDATAGVAAYGIFAHGARSSVTVEGDGKIATTGARAHGVHSRGAAANIVNDGRIETTGQGARGIVAAGPNTLLTNHGAIVTKGGLAFGMASAGIDTTTTQAGAITTEGDRAHGIYSDGAHVTINSEGGIATTGNSASGIYSQGADARITHRGVITTDGQGDATAGVAAYGIFAHGARSSVTVEGDGKIATTGERAHGVHSRGAAANIVNDGRIETTGQGAHGIVAVGDGADITVSGQVLSTGDGASAIRGDVHLLEDPGRKGSDQTVRLLPGARIEGAIALGYGNDEMSLTLEHIVHAELDGIDLGAGDDRVVIRSGNDADSMLRRPDSSLATTFEHAETIVFENAAGERAPAPRTIVGLPVVRNNHTVQLVDPTGAAAERGALAAASRRVHGVVLRQATRAAAPGGHRSWARVFTEHAEREAEGAARAWERRLHGAVGGYAVAVSDRWRVGAFAAFRRGRVETKAESVTLDTNGYFLGAYGTYAVGRWAFNGSLLYRYGRHDGKRAVRTNVQGLAVASGDYTSSHVSPSLGLVGTFGLTAGLDLRLLARVAYTGGRFGGYSETGARHANLHIAARDARGVDGSLQLGLAHAFADGRGEVGLLTGVNAMRYGHDRVTARLDGGVPGSWRVPGDELVLGGHVGGAVRFDLADRVSLVGQLEYRRASGREEELLAQVGLSVRF